MNILILDSWLREYLTTNANPRELANALSLCGPTVDRIHKRGKDYIYDIEVTTNRVDVMSVYGIAREARAILKQFGYKAQLKDLSPNKPKPPKGGLSLNIKSNKKLVNRTMGVVVEDIKNWKSPDWMVERLEAVGMRSLNSIVDITNYVMMEVGHPMHAFDYDKIPDSTIIIRESKKGEKIVSLDDKEYTLSGGDIVFQSTSGEIIDLPGIIGTKNSVVSSSTKRVLFFIDNNDPMRIRKSSMSLGIRTLAAIINEKNVDPDLGETALFRSIELVQRVCKAKIASKVYDFYVNKSVKKQVKTTHAFIEDRLGVSVTKKRIQNLLSDLKFSAKWSGNTLSVTPPSFRNKDINIPEDIVEEVARLYGYHNLPDNIMATELPERPDNSPFDFENSLLEILKNSGGYEVYTVSTVAKESVSNQALKIKNPLGADSEYLRTTLVHSLTSAASSNNTTDPFFLFEIGNVYLSKKGSLPEEKMMIAGIFSSYNFRKAKGIVENLLKQLYINYQFKLAEKKDFKAGRHLKILNKKTPLGRLGILENSLIYFDFSVELLKKHSKQIMFKPNPKYPPQVEDVTFKIPQKTQVGDLIQSIKSLDTNVTEVSLKDIFKNRFTFTIHYQHPKKTLTNAEVEKIRNKIIAYAEKKFGAVI